MKNGCKALSLVEIVVAMNCTALLLAVLCASLPLARRQMHEADIRLGGALLAQSAIEQYLTVPLDQWPSEPITLPGDWRSVELKAVPWPADSRLVKVSAVVKIRGEERYRLETVVFP